MVVSAQYLRVCCGKVVLLIGKEEEERIFSHSAVRSFSLSLLLHPPFGDLSGRLFISAIQPHPLPRLHKALDDVGVPPTLLSAPTFVADGWLSRSLGGNERVAGERVGMCMYNESDVSPSP